jgi:hypothetical protein
MIGVKLEALKLSWNSQAILTPAEKFQKRLLGSFGAYCMRTQRNSIKRASQPHQRSDEGSPPLHHATPLLNGQGFKGTIFFAVDLRKKECSIGPVLLNGTAAGGQRVPEVLEKGGVIVLLSGARRDRRRRSIQVRARPSAQPAFEKTVKKKLPELIAGGIMREV